VITADELLAAMDLPADSRVNQRIPKKLLLENGAPTAADRRQINEGIEELFWLAALKPTTCGVPAYRDDDREYVEVAVLRLALRAGAKATRLVELVHRAVPYPVLLLTETGAAVGISAAHKRWSQGEEGKTVLDGEVVTIELDDAPDAERWPAFREALALGHQPRATLLTLYQGWVDTLFAWQAAGLTGTFAVPDDAKRAVARRDALRECAQLDIEIARLRDAAEHESQISRQMDLNLELKRRETQLSVAKARL
jgi:hypothetical protein